MYKYVYTCRLYQHAYIRLQSSKVFMCISLKMTNRWDTFDCQKRLGQLNNTPKPRRPGVRCTRSALVCTSCSRGVQENGAICLVVLQTAEILGLIICFAIHFLCMPTTLTFPSTSSTAYIHLHNVACMEQIIKSH